RGEWGGRAADRGGGRGPRAEGGTEDPDGYAGGNAVEIGDGLRPADVRRVRKGTGRAGRTVPWPEEGRIGRRVLHGRPVGDRESVGPGLAVIMATADVDTAESEDRGRPPASERRHSVRDAPDSQARGRIGRSGSQPHQQVQVVPVRGTVQGRTLVGTGRRL